MHNRSASFADGFLLIFMKRSSHTGFGLPLFISFNELAWLVVVGVALISAARPIESNPQPKSLKKEKESIDKNLQMRLAEGERNLADSQKQLKKSKDEKHQIENQMQTLKREMADQNRLLENFKKQLQKNLQSHEHEVEKLNRLLEKGRMEVADLKRQIIPKQESVHKRLLGLEGDLEYVGILLDRSSSMKGERWTGSIQLVETWLNHLAMEKCFLITFNDHPESFPKKVGEYFDVSGRGGIENRRRLIEAIQGIEPKGYTGTLKALKMAYHYPHLQTILLFTDGDPKLRNQTNRKIKENRAEIIALCQKQKELQGVKVNTVAIGDYFEKDFGKFLFDIAKKTGGAFIGR